jgi:hypothetical protein
MQDQHLRPVPSVTDDEPQESEPTGGSGEQTPPTSTQPAKSKPRPTKALPTDRMKLEVQKKALSVIAIISDYGKVGVSAADMAPRLEVAATTAGLNNSFFHDAGLIVRDGKGKFKSTPAANDYALKFSFNADEAGLALREPLSQTWFYGVVRQQIKGMGPTPKAKLIELLAYEAGATKDYRVQLNSIVSWLEYAGLIESDDDETYKLTDAAPSSPESAEPEKEPEPAKKPAPEPTPEGATKAPAGGQRNQDPETILGFSFDFALTGDELAKLSPEQITALFTAVGEVLKIKAAL